MRTEVTVRVDGGPIVRLGPRAFVAAGGEGRVYARRGTAYKIYDDPARALHPHKLAELARIADARVLAPTALLLREPDGARVGYTMPFCRNAWVLAQLVPGAFWARHGLNAPAAIAIAQRLGDLLGVVHAAGCCIADLSATNVLIEPGSRQPVLIDTDSWQTPSHPATAVTPEIRDPLQPAGRFTEESDWFSLAVLAFELLVGIHPFKGRHPRIRGLEARLRAGISVLDPEVSHPAACRPLTDIPPAWRAWFHEVFARGHRSPLPTLAHRRRGAPDDRREAPDAALPLPSGDVLDIRLDVEQGALVFRSGRPVWPPTLTVGASALVEHEGVVFILAGDRISRIDALAVGERVVVGLQPVASVMPHATGLWPGVAIQRLARRTHALLLDGRGRARPVFVPELDGQVIVDAAHAGDVLVVVVRQGSALHRWTWVCDAPGEARVVRRDQDVASGAVGTVAPRQTISAPPPPQPANPAKRPSPPV